MWDFFFFFLHWLWRFSPRLNHKKFWLLNKSTKDTHDAYKIWNLTFLFFFSRHWNLSQMCLYEAERATRSDDYGRCQVCTHVCVCVFVFEHRSHIPWDESSVGGRVGWIFFGGDYHIGLMESRTCSSFFLKRGQKSVNVAKPVRLILRVTLTLNCEPGLTLYITI